MNKSQREYLELERNQIHTIHNIVKEKSKDYKQTFDLIDRLKTDEHSDETACSLKADALINHVMKVY